MLQPQGMSAATQHQKRDVFSPADSWSLSRAMLTIDLSHHSWEGRNFDLCKAFVTAAASRKKYWGQMGGLVKRSHSERHRKKEIRGASRIHCVHGRKGGQEAMEVE